MRKANFAMGTEQERGMVEDVQKNVVYLNWMTGIRMTRMMNISRSLQGDKEIMPQNKHTEYFLKDGTRIPGVTTVLGIIAKPALAPAANRLGLQNINSTIYWRELADIGTLAHHLILSHLQKVKPDTSGYSISQIDKAENSFLSYLEWEKHHKIEPVLLETPQVSEIFRYGGTPDIVCHLDEQTELNLIDIKTGGIYREHYWQLSGYAQLLLENNYHIEDGLILGIPRTADESFQEQWLNKDGLKLGLDPFLCCLDLYYAIKNYEKEVKEEK